MSAMKLLPPEGKTRYPLSQAQIAALFQASESLKESALLHLYYSLGLRRSEGVALNLRDVHFKLCLVYVRSGKGGKRRVVPMPEKVSHALEEYVLKERGYGRAEAFILSKSGHRHSGGWCNKLVKLLMERANQAGAGIEATASLHHLRHSIASHLLESGLSVEQISHFLGHSRLDTTAVYAHIAHLWLKEEKQKK